MSGINSLLHSANLILFTLLLIHLILRISPHHSHHLRSHHLSLPRPFTLVFLVPFELPSWILDLDWTKWAPHFKFVVTDLIVISQVVTK